jgi:hypothetical protein
MKTFIFKKSNLIVLFLVIFYAISPIAVSAVGVSKVYFKPSVTTFSPKSEFSVEVFVDGANSINAIELDINYPANLVGFLNSDTNHSIISFWQSGGAFVSPGHLHLSGGILPSFSGVGGLVATLHFKALASGDAKFSFEKNNLYLADGKGTKENSISSGVTLHINASAPTIELPPVPNPALIIDTQNTDKTPPTLTARVIKDPVFNNLIIVYKAEDPESGIKFVQMRTQEEGKWSNWYNIENPTPYPTEARKVELRAVNSQGLDMVQSLSTSHANPKLFTIIIVLAITFIIILVYNKVRHMPKL